MAEWTSTRSYADRVKNLMGDLLGNHGQQPQGHNVDYFLAVDATPGRGRRSSTTAWRTS